MSDDNTRYLLSAGPEGMEHDYCSDCGSSAGWEECTNCEDGMSGHDCGEDCCACLYPENNVPCDICDGKGGWWVCLGGHVLTVPKS